MHTIIWLFEAVKELKGADFPSSRFVGLKASMLSKMDNPS